jgi:hypothetical protein
MAQYDVMPWPKLKRDRTGIRVRSTRTLKNGSYELPAGSIFTVEGWYRGASLWTEPCPHCGVRVYITKVPESALEPIKRVEEQE